MRNPALWAKTGVLFCLAMCTFCWCATGAMAAGPIVPAQPVGTTEQAAASSGNAGAIDEVDTRISVRNSGARDTVDAPGHGVVHAIPTLNGFGLLVLASLLGVAALWMWRRRQ